ncbi:MAG: hypothetical protein LDL07_06200 [Desulfarculus sp.]|nr:hypothetical protein [Desulfarculus sp.]
MRARRSPEAELAHTLATWEIELATHEGRLAGLARYLEDLATMLGEHRERMSDTRRGLAGQAEEWERTGGRRVKRAARALVRVLEGMDLGPEDARAALRLAGEMWREGE